MLLPLFCDVAATTPTRAPPAAVAPAPPAARAAPRALPRGELDVSVGLAGGATLWPSDPLGYGSLTIGLRLFRFVTPYVGAALGYARVDQRMLTRLNVGVQLGWPIAERFYPRAYVAFVHQHEESLASVANEPAGALLGIGTGIRHRAGVHFGAGFDVVFFQRPNLHLAVGPDLSAMYLTYSSGPDWYLVAGVTLAGRFRLF